MRVGAVIRSNTVCVSLEISMLQVDLITAPI